MSEIKVKGKVAVFYPDGGAGPSNPGFAGTGLHGYVFTEHAPKAVIIPNHFLALKITDNKAPPKVCPTDQGYVNCDKDGLVSKNSDAKTVKPDFYMDAVISYGSFQTNNYAELMGVAYAFQVASEIEGLEKIIIRPDSQYALDCIETYGDRWRKNGWLTAKLEPVKNAEVIEEILTARDALIAKGVKIKFVKVKGHADDLGNNTADYLATIGVNRAKHADIRVDLQWATNRKYWEVDVPRHPMLQARRFIYNRKVELNDLTEVFMIEPADTDLKIGKRDHEGYAVVRLATACPTYAELLDSQKDYGQEENWPMNVKTDRLYDKTVQRYFKKFGKACFFPNATKNGVFFLDGGNIALEHNPPALIYRSIDAFGELTTRLEEFLELSKEGFEDNTVGYAGDFHGIQGVDITGDFYDTVEKKVGKETLLVKVLKKEIEVGYQRHFVGLTIVEDKKEEARNLPITLGMDLPSRNSLKKLETEDPRITLITWRTAPGTFQYACVVEAQSGLGIWSNFYCNRFFI